MKYSFTEAAYKILRASGKPMHTLEIVQKALEKGLIETHGETPKNTMYASLFLENKRRTEHSRKPRFKHISKSTWGLNR